MRLVNIDSIYYWHGKPIANLDQRNEVEAHLRAEIAECKAKMDAESGQPFSMWSHWFDKKFRAECALGNLHRAEFINPNEGMLL